MMMIICHSLIFPNSGDREDALLLFYLIILYAFRKFICRCSHESIQQTLLVRQSATSVSVCTYHNSKAEMPYTESRPLTIANSR